MWREFQGMNEGLTRKNSWEGGKRHLARQTRKEQLGRGQAVSSGTDRSDPERAPADLILTDRSSQVHSVQYLTSD